MRRFLILLAALLGLTSAVPAWAQWDGSPGSRPHDGQARGNRLSLRGGSGIIYPVTILQKTTTQSIANNTSALYASWDTTPVQDDLGAFLSGSPTVVTVPSGITRMRITYFINWTANNTGIRNHAIQLVGGANQYGIAAPASNETAITVTSRWLTVSAGQQYELNLFQTSGGALNFNGGSVIFGNSWIQFEWAP